MWHVLVGFLRLELLDLKEYHRLVEGFLKERNDVLSKESSRFKNESPEIYDEYSTELGLIGHEFPGILRESIFIKGYSIFEYSLDKVCSYIASKNNLNLALADLNDKGIFRSQKYLKKVAEIKFPDHTEEWRRIVLYNEIRNALVHNAGKIRGKCEKDKAQKIERLRAIQSIKISQKAIKLTESFIPEVVNDFDSVLNYVENNIR